MTRSVPLTYAGALTLLEGRSGRIAKLMDRLVGTGILLGAVVFPPAVALVDVRQEISRSLGDLLEASAAKMRGECGRSRLDYVAAAHTTLVLASLFDAFSAEMGSRFAAMHVTDEEKLRLATSPGRLANDRIASGGHIVTQQEWIDAVLAVDVPLPSAVRGFEENLREELIPRVTALSASALSFLGGLAAWQDLPRASRLRPSQVVSCWESFYRERFVRLAADIPEFFIWTALGEHGATRLQLSRLDNHLTAALEAQSETLGKLHDLLASGIAYRAPAKS